MRQYRIFYKRGQVDQFATLEPGVHAGIYNKPEVETAIGLIRDFPYIEGIALRVGVEQFNIIAFEQEAEAPNAFKFTDATEPG